MLRKTSDYIVRKITPNDSELDTAIYKCSVCGMQHILNTNDEKIICPCGHINKFTKEKPPKSNNKDNNEELYFKAIFEFSETGKYAAE